MNALMLAFAYSLPYHVLRTASAAGSTVHVLGSGPSRGLRTSRYCASYSDCGIGGNGEQDPEAALRHIKKIVAERRIDIVFPSDDVSTRLLTRLRGRLPVRTTLLPDTATFDLLNDKWNFCRFAQDNGVRIPETWLYDDLAAVRQDLRSGALTLPVTVKPTNRSGGVGVLHIKSELELALLDRQNYAPALVQRYIAGQTVGISVMCRDGRIFMHATQWYDDRRFCLFPCPDLLDNATKVVQASGLSGPAFFDAILETATGLTYIVECNPRFWFSMYMPAFIGLNFVEAAMNSQTAGSTDVRTIERAEIHRTPRRLLAQPWQGNRQDWRYLAYQLSDPLAYTLQRLKFFDDHAVAVSAETMGSYEPAPVPACRPQTRPVRVA